MRGIYDYDGWFDRGRFVLIRGQDYHTTQANMCQLLRNAATKRSLRINLSDLDDRIAVAVRPRVTKTMETVS